MLIIKKNIFISVFECVNERVLVSLQWSLFCRELQKLTWPSTGQVFLSNLKELLDTYGVRWRGSPSRKWEKRASYHHILR